MERFSPQTEVSHWADWWAVGVKVIVQKDQKLHFTVSLTASQHLWPPITQLTAWCPEQLSFTGAAPPTTHLVVVFNSWTIIRLGHVRREKCSPDRNPGSVLTLRDTVFCSTSNRNCSCSRDAVSAGWEGSARNPCCLLLGSRYCSNIRVSCCKLDAVRVSVLLPSSTKSPGGRERQLLSHLGDFQLTEKRMLHLRTEKESALLKLWSAGFPSLFVSNCC